MFTQGTSGRKKFSYENVVFLVHTMQRQTTEMKEFVERHPDEWVATQPLVETIRELAEVVVWGDKFEESVFLVFLENNVMQIFEDLVLYSRCPSAVRVQVIQAINILLQNLTNQPSLFSVCSNNHLNRIIQLQVDPDDEELQSIYVSFLKTLCLRLNQDTVQFFFQQPSPVSPTTTATNPAAPLATSGKETNCPTTSPRSTDCSRPDEPLPASDAASGDAQQPGNAAVEALLSTQEFPLMSQAVVLLASEDSIVRTAARQIVVTVLQLSDGGVVEYLKRTMESVLRHFVSLIGKQVTWLLDRVWVRCHFSEGMAGVGGGRAVGTHNVSWATVGAMDHHVEDLLDDMYYINDLFQVPHAFVAESLRRIVESEIVDNMVVRSIDACLDDANTDTPSCALSIALLICAHWLRVNTTPAIHEMLSLRLLSEPQYDAPSRLISILKSDRLVGSHALALSVILAWWSSKFTEDDARRKLVGAADVGQPTVAMPDTTEAGGANGNLSCSWSWESIRPTLGRYRASLQRGSLYEQTSATAEALTLPASVASHPLLAAVANSLQLQVRHKEATRFVALEITVASVFHLFQWTPRDAMELVFKRAAVEAQHNLLLRVELYRQHLWMLYGATGENSLLTPSSFLCQLLHRDADREISDPLEAVFARLEMEYDLISSAIKTAIPPRSANGGTCLIDLQPTYKLMRDVALLCPLMPPLACWSTAASNSLQGELRHADKHVNAYLALQQKGNAGVPVWRRAPQDEDEIEHIELSVWILLRYVLLTLCRDVVDPLEGILKRSQCQRAQGDVVRAWDLTAMVDVPAVRCEFTPDGPLSTPSPAPGCVLYLFIVNSDVLLVAPSKESPESLGTVAFALRAMYCEAIVHSRQLFKLRVVEDAPNATGTRTVSIVLRDRSVCQKTAQAIQCRATQWKRESCATLWTLILDEPQRVILDLFHAVV